MIKNILFLFVLAFPSIVLAQSTVQGLLGRIANLIINPLIVLGFTVATVYLFYSIVQLVAGADGSDLDKKKNAVIYGVVGLFVMFSVFGILRLVLRTFGIVCEGWFFC